MVKTTNTIENANAITHGGTFHADEVLATVLLEKVFGNISIMRTFKVPETTNNENLIIFDIGGGKFDHHQKGGNGIRENGVPYAAAGLIWKEYGMSIVSTSSNPKLTFEIIERDLILGVDAIDNGALPKTDYAAQALSFSREISLFNPTWDSELTADECFLQAVDFARTVFDKLLANANSTAKAQKIVDKAIENSENSIMVLERFLPWQEFIFASENTKASDILFVVFPSNRGGYNWQCVPKSLGSFEQRKPVPDSWKGLNGENLQKASGVQSASFCHPAGFIGAAETLGDAIKMAEIAVNS